MKLQVPSLVLAFVAVAIGSAAGGHTAVAGPSADNTKRGAPIVGQMVVLRGGKASWGPAHTERATVKVGQRKCTIAAATPLAALIHSSPRALRLRDYGSCSSRAADSSGLFVRSMYGFTNRGLDGWVYKVGRRLATAGAADPAGPFGNGRLRRSSRVVWFYCVFEEGSCQRSLEIARRKIGNEVLVTVKGFDDAGKGDPVADATVAARRIRGKGVAETAKTGSDGSTSLRLERGRYYLRATKRGLIRSFDERVTIP